MYCMRLQYLLVRAESSICSATLIAYLIKVCWIHYIFVMSKHSQTGKCKLKWCRCWLNRERERERERERVREREREGEGGRKRERERESLNNADMTWYAASFSAGALNNLFYFLQGRLPDVDWLCNPRPWAIAGMVFATIHTSSVTHSGNCQGKQQQASSCRQSSVLLVGSGWGLCWCLSVCVCVCVCV